MVDLHYTIHHFLIHASILLACYFICANLLSLVLIFVAWYAIRREENEPVEYFRNKSNGKVSVLVPAFNESKTICESVAGILENQYADFEVIVVDDGSTDSTIQNLITEYELFETYVERSTNLSSILSEKSWISKKDHRLKVLKISNHGKATALNHAIDHASGEFICTLDADTMIEKTALQRAIEPFDRFRGSLIGVGASLRIANGASYQKGRGMSGHLPKFGLPLMQILEYIRAFYLGRVGWDYLDATTLLSGAFAVFRKSAVIDVGGYDPNSITEDLELTLRLRKKFAGGNGRRFKMVYYPLAWTFVPESLSDLQRQRVRWQRGLFSSLWTHRSLLLNFRQRWVGLVAVPYLVVFELLGPYFELLGYAVITLGLLHGVFKFSTVLLILGLGIAYSLFLTLVTIHMEEKHFSRHPSFKRDRFRFLLAALVDCLGFRQLVWFFRLCAMFEIFYKPAAWGKHRRIAFENQDPKSRKKAA